jgi:hypothetical protein
MNRREFVSGASAAALLPLAGVRAQVRSEAPINVVERFGFVGDDRTDNYEALHRLAAFASRSGGGSFLFPRGRYFIGRHRTIDYKSRDPRQVINPHWFRCDGLNIQGDGAAIRLSGRFHRSARVGRDGLGVGMHAATLIPFEIRQSRNVRISGLEIDGGVRETTKDDGLLEAYAALVSLNACSRISLSNLNLHHCQTDAIYLSDDVHLAGGRGIACRDITLERVLCSNNARGGLAVIQAYGVRCVDSAFNGGAFGTGRYGRHAPGFGVDAEPDRYEPHQVDTRTGNLEFVRCEFLDNFSAFLAAYVRKYQGFLRLTDCRSSNANNTPHQFIFAWNGALVEGGEFDLGEGTMWTSWEGQEGGDVTVRGCSVRGSGRFGIFHAFPNNMTTLDRVRLTGTHRSAGPGNFPAIEADPGGGRRNLVRNCEFFLPAARKSREQLYDLDPSFNHCRCEGNTFRTDLPARGGQHFATQYSADTIVRGDIYRGTASGPADSFRPRHLADHDTRQPFSKAG